jgi:putative transcriptional regulator
LRRRLAAIFLFALWAIAPVRAADLDAPLILVARPKLHDPVYGATILLAAPVGNGRHLGFIINRPTRMTLGKLFPGHAPSQEVPEPVYFGGPFGTQHIFALVERRNSPGGNSVPIGPGLFVALDAKTVDRIIEAEATHARFFAGLVAWQPGELREELERGLWYVLEPETELVMRKPADGLWEELVNRSERRANTI